MPPSSRLDSSERKRGDATMKTSPGGGHSWLPVGNVPVHVSSWLRSELTDAYPRYTPSGALLGTVTVKARLD
jgi:hypothetical protein